MQIFCSVTRKIFFAPWRLNTSASSSATWTSVFSCSICFLTVSISLRFFFPSLTWFVRLEISSGKGEKKAKLVKGTGLRCMISSTTDYSQSSTGTVVMPSLVNEWQGHHWHTWGFELDKGISSTYFVICQKVAYSNWWGWCLLEDCAVNNLHNFTWWSCSPEPCQILPGGAPKHRPGILTLSG